MTKQWPKMKLGEVLSHYTEYINAPEPREYRKLSVKLYGKGVVLDAPADGTMLKMQRHQLAKAGQVILSEIWGKKGAIGFVPPEGEGALCTSHFFLFDILEDKLDRRWLKAIFDANYLQEQLDAGAKGTTGYAAVRPKNFLACEVPLPSLAEQRRVVARIEALAAQIHEARTLRHQAAEEAEALVASETNALFTGEDMNQWPTKSLEEISEIRSGVTLGRQLTTRTIRLPYLRVANVQDGHLNLANMKEVEVLESEADKWKLQRGDLLLTEGGDWDKLGRGTIWREEIPNCIHQNHIFRVRIKRETFVPEFVAKLISSPVGKTYFQEASKQTTNLASINQRQLKAFKVFQPPLVEQRRIVAELDALQAEVDALKRLQAETATELGALLPAILDKAFKGEL